MAKRSKAAGVPAGSDPRSEASELLRRLTEDDALRDAVAALLGEAASAVSTPGRGRGRCGLCGRLTAGRLLKLGALGSVGALAASSGLRSKLLDALFGAEEEFEYSPPAEGTAGLSAV